MLDDAPEPKNNRFYWVIFAAVFTIGLIMGYFFPRASLGIAIALPFLASLVIFIDREALRMTFEEPLPFVWAKWSLPFIGFLAGGALNLLLS